MTIPVQEYLTHSFTLSRHELNLIGEFAAWLPDSIIDAHAHCGRPEHVLGLDDMLLKHMLSTFPSFTLEQSVAMQRVFFRDKLVRALRFPKPVRGIDHRAANEYLLTQSPITDRVALYGIPTDPEYTLSMLDHARVSGLKMYYQFFSPPATTIYEFFTPEILEGAQARDVPIVLHLPKMITRCVEDLMRLLRDFPRLRVVLAHLGLPHLPVPGLAETYGLFAQFKTVCMDTAMIPSADVVRMALNAFGIERVLYGSDQPLNLIRAVVYDHPTKGQRLAATYPYHWVDREEQDQYGRLAQDAVHMHWQGLKALRVVLDELPTSQREAAKRAVFHDNAARVYGF